MEMVGRVAVDNTVVVIWGQSTLVMPQNPEFAVPAQEMLACMAVDNTVMII
jgi:hypothetical protein